MQEERRNIFAWNPYQDFFFKETKAQNTSYCLFEIHEFRHVRWTIKQKLSLHE